MERKKATIINHNILVINSYHNFTNIIYGDEKCTRFNKFNTTAEGTLNEAHSILKDEGVICAFSVPIQLQIGFNNKNK